MAILDLQETHGIWFRYLRSAACICWSKAFLFLYICKLCDSNFKNARSSILPADSRFSVCNLFVLTRCARQQQFRIGRFILFWTKMNCKSARWESHFFLWLLAYLMYNAWNSWRPWCIESATKRRQDLQSNPTNVAAYILKFTLQVEVGRAYALFFSLFRDLQCSFRIINMRRACMFESSASISSKYWALYFVISEVFFSERQPVCHRRNDANCLTWSPDPEEACICKLETICNLTWHTDMTYSWNLNISCQAQRAQQWLDRLNAKNKKSNKARQARYDLARKVLKASWV